MTIGFDIQDRTAIIRIDRPERANAIDPSTAARLAARVEQVESDDDILCAVLTGSGQRHFCAGSDLKAKAAGEESTITGYGFIDRPHSKPFIAAVNGVAAGGGFELALACDLVLAVPHARFSLPEVSHGVVASGGGLIRLARRLPSALAREVGIAGRALDADLAMAWGLVNRVVPAEGLLESALDLAETIGRSAPLAVRESLAVLHLAAGENDPELWERSRRASLTVLDSVDGDEGPRAFAEGRAPVWSGRWSD